MREGVVGDVGVVVDALGFVGDMRTGLEERREGSKGLSGEVDIVFDEVLGRPGSSKDVFVCGDGSTPGLIVLKKLTAKAGFSSRISKNRKSSFRFKGRPGLRKRTSLVLIKVRNKL